MTSMTQVWQHRSQQITLLLKFISVEIEWTEKSARGFFFFKRKMRLDLLAKLMLLFELSNTNISIQEGVNIWDSSSW